LCVAHRYELLPGADLLGLLRRLQISVALLPPSVLAILSPEDLPALRTIVAVGEACGAEVVARWAEGRLFINGYGPTEVTIGASYAVCADGERKPPIGRPFANVEIYILDGQLEPLPVGVAGQLYVSSPGLARGYLGQPGLTAEKFIPHLYSGAGGERLYGTGDLGRYLADGNIEFLGRIDEQVKIRGYRIELGEIEAVLNEHEGVSQAVVIARQQGNKSQRLIAYVVLRRDAHVFEIGDESEHAVEGRSEKDRGQELRDYLEKYLPGYMVPSAMVMMDKMPLTASGKVDRHALPDPIQTKEEDGSYDASRGAVEELLAAIWSRVLGVERVGVHDNFFELGGHSLLSTQVASRIRVIFKIEMPLRSLFEEPTLRGLARKIEASIRAGEELAAPGMERVSREGELPLSFAQQRLWFL